MRPAQKTIEARRYISHATYLLAAHPEYALFASYLRLVGVISMSITTSMSAVWRTCEFLVILFEKALSGVMRINKLSDIPKKVKNRLALYQHQSVYNCQYLTGLIRAQKHKFQDYRKLKSLSDNQDNLYQILMKYDVISFDIFDTLITRSLYDPIDVFRLMEKELSIDSFSTMRVNAERKAIQHHDRDVNLDDIYEEIKTISSSEKEEIKQLEIDTEIKIMIRRELVVDIYHRLINAGKIVYCVSDMYLPQSAIESIFEKCQIKLPVKMIISNCVNKRKDSMTMWPYVKELTKGKSYIHIGDNFISDFINPGKHNIASAYLSSSHFLVEHSTFGNQYRLLKMGKIGDEIIKGLLFNKKIFNSPFRSTSIGRYTLRDIGYIVYGPILLYFCLWIYQQVKREKYDAVFFFAREGYYLEPLYDKITQLVYGIEENTYYFLTSRLAAATASFNNKEEIEEYLQEIPFDGTFSKLLKERFSLNIDVKDDATILLPRDVKKVLYRLEPYIPDILKNAEKYKSLYQRYTNQLLSNYEEKKVAVVDIGYSGTAQYYMSKVLNKFNLNGLYLYLGENIKPHRLNEKADSCVPLKDGKWVSWMLMETILTAPDPQFVGFESKDDKLCPVYRPELITAEKKRQLEELFSGVNRFVNDYLTIDKSPSLADISLSLILSLLQALNDGEILPTKSNLNFFSVDVAFDGANRTKTLKFT